MKPPRSAAHQIADVARAAALRAAAERRRVPIGTICTRKCSSRNGAPRFARAIKVRECPRGKRGKQWSAWRPYAEWWWEQNRGPIPAGRRIYHIDGDPLNDDPTNYACWTLTEKVANDYRRDPTIGLRRAKHPNVLKWVRRWGREQRTLSAIRRLSAIIPWEWYPVDFEKRHIVNNPKRTAYAVHATAGIKAKVRGALLPAAVGFPKVRRWCCASVLAVLADHPGEQLCARPLLAAVAVLRERHAFRAPLKHSSLMCSVWLLRKQGLVESIHIRGRSYAYRATPLAISSRGRVSPFAAVRGRDLERRCAGFARVHADGSPIGRAKGQRSLNAMRDACAHGYASSAGARCPFCDNPARLGHLICPNCDRLAARNGQCDPPRCLWPIRQGGECPGCGRQWPYAPNGRPKAP